MVIKYLLAALAILAMWKQGDCLECYSCISCSPSFLSFTYDKQICNSLQTACYKEIEDDGDVNRGCADAFTCGGKLLSPGECRGDSIKPCYICCEGDDCNSSTMIAISLGTLFLSLAAVFFTRY